MSARPNSKPTILPATENQPNRDRKGVGCRSHRATDSWPKPAPVSATSFQPATASDAASPIEVAIGDQVTFSPERRRIEEIQPRRTVLSRTDPHNPRIQRVIAANVDIVVNVVSLKTPPLHPGLIDRYLIAIGKSGAAPLICVNKVDLQASPEELDPMRPYQDVGIPVIFCSAATGAGLAELSEALAGKLCVFAGHSGVGKSSLLNALDPKLEIATGSVSSANAKGRHTTTSSALYRFAKRCNSNRHPRHS